MRLMTILATLIALTGFASSQAVAWQQWQEGVHYHRLPDAPERPADAPIEVTEVFWYGCGACFQFEPLVDEWERSRPADVEFTRIGITFSGAAQIHARAYYTAEALGVAECVHRPIFNAIHRDRRRLDSPDALARFFEVTAGVNAEAFQSAWDGFGVDRRLRSGDQLVRQMRIGSTPTVVVNRRFTLTPSSAGGFMQAIALLNHVIELERGAPNEFTEPRPVEPCTPADAAADATPADAAADATPADAAMQEEAPGGLSLKALLPLIAVAVIALIGFGVWTSRKKG